MSNVNVEVVATQSLETALAESQREMKMDEQQRKSRQMWSKTAGIVRFGDHEDFNGVGQLQDSLAFLRFTLSLGQ